MSSWFVLPVLIAGCASLAGCAIAQPKAAELGPTPRQAAVVEKLDVLAALKKPRGFTTMVRLLEASGYAASLRDEGPWTVFAPTDEAFAKLPEGTLESLETPESHDALRTLVANHIVAGSLDSGGLRKRAKVEATSGAPLSIRAEGVRLRVEGALIEAVDLEASNGVLHAIDTVLTPKVTPP